MDLFKIAAITGYSIVFAAMTGLVRYKQTLPTYRPFIWLTWLALVNHSLSIALAYQLNSNAVNGNLFVLIESLLYIWCFSNWGRYTFPLVKAFLLAALLIMVWITDNFILHSIYTPNAGFRIFSSLLLIILSIEQITKLVVSYRQALTQNSVFLICSGLLISFSYKAFIEVFFLVQTNASLSFITGIYVVLIYINCFVNLLFFLALLWTPTKKKFIFSS